MLEYRILGPVEVRRDDLALDLGPPKQRAVLAALLLARGAVVGTDRLIDTVWGDHPPAAAITSLQAYISNLRRILRTGTEPSPISRVGTGYFLDLGSDRLDLIEFDGHTRTARQARDDHHWQDALAESHAGLELWRDGPSERAVGETLWAGGEYAALAEMHAALQEIHVAALLAADDTGAALAEIVTLRADDRLRDRGVWLHMMALHRAGRSTEALAEFAEHQRVLDDELGLVPGTELVDLQGAILRHDPSIAAWPRQPQWSGAREVSAPVDSGPPVPRIITNGTRAVPPLIGRDVEIARLRAALGSGGVGSRWVMVSGPAGIGKTRVAEEIADWAQAGGEQALWVRCPEADGVPAWWPLRQLCRAVDADPDATLSVPPGVDADTARFAVYERIERLLVESAPLTVIVDDVQWADPMTVGLLSYLTTALRDRVVDDSRAASGDGARAPVATVILTVRDGEGGPEIDRLQAAISRVDGTQISLGYLDQQAVAQLMRSVTEEEIDASDVESLTRRTGGNPLFVCEFARLPAAERREMIPARVRSVLGRRLGSLDPAVLEVLGHAAVMGDEIDLSLLAAVTGRTSVDLADDLDEAIDERILVVESGSGRTRFAHALLRDEALASIRPLRRCRIHAAVADALGSASGAAASARRATHLLQALPIVDPQIVVDACRAAADDATALWDSENAAHFLQAALGICESAEVNLRAADRDDLLLELLAAHSRSGHLQIVLDMVEQRLHDAIRIGATASIGRLAAALIRSGGAWPWIGPQVEEDSPLQLALTDAAHATAEDAPSLCRVLAAAAIGECYHRDATVPATLLDRARRIADDLDDDEFVADVTLARLITYSGVAEHAAEAVELADRLRGLRYDGRDVDGVIVDTVLTMSTMALGDVAATERHVRRGVVGSERLRLPICRAQLRWMEASLAVWRGEMDRATEHFRIAHAVHEQTELYVAGSGAIAMMAMAAERGLLDEVIDTGGLDPVTWARAVSEQFTDNQVVVLLAAGIAKIAGAHGDVELARSMVRTWIEEPRAMIWTSLAQAVLLGHVVAEIGFLAYASPLIDYLAPYRGFIATVGQVGCVGPVALALAELCYLVGDDDRGDDFLAEATAVARRGGGVPSELRCRLLAVTRQPWSESAAADITRLELRARACGLDHLADAAHEILSAH